MKTMTAPANAAPATHDLALDLCGLLCYLHKASSGDMFRALGELDLSLTQVKALHVLQEDEADEIHLKDLADRLGISLPAASRAVEGLHQRGCVAREEDAQDRRLKDVRVTDSGRALVQRLNESRLSALEDFAAALTPTERRRLGGALACLLARPEIAGCRPKADEA